MPILHVKAPDGHTLNIQVPEGTDTSQYGTMADDALTHYQSMPKPSQPLAQAPGYNPSGILGNLPNQAASALDWMGRNTVQPANEALGRINRFTQEEAPQAIADTVAGKMGMPKTARALMGGEMAAGGLVPGSINQGIAMAATGPVLKGVAGIAGKALKPAGDILAEVMAKGSGKSQEFFRTLFENPEMLQTVKRTIGHLEQSTLVESIENGMRDIGSGFQKLEDRFASSVDTLGERRGMPRINTREILDKVKKEAGEWISGAEEGAPQFTYGTRNVPAESGGIMGAGTPEETQDIITGVKKGRAVASNNAPIKYTPGEVSAIQEGHDIVQKANNEPWGVIRQARQRIDKMIHWKANGLPALGEDGERYLIAMRQHLNDALANALPDTQKKIFLATNQAYSEGLDAMNGLRRMIVGQEPEQTAGKVLARIKKGEMPLSYERANQISADVAGRLKVIEGHLISNELQDWLPRKGEPWRLSDFLSPSSPRNLGKLTAKAGKAYKSYGPVVSAVHNAVLNHPAGISAIAQSLATQFSSPSKTQQPAQP